MEKLNIKFRLVFITGEGTREENETLAGYKGVSTVSFMCFIFLSEQIKCMLDA